MADINYEEKDKKFFKKRQERMQKIKSNFSITKEEGKSEIMINLIKYEQSLIKESLNKAYIQIEESLEEAKFISESIKNLLDNEKYISNEDAELLKKEMGNINNNIENLEKAIQDSSIYNITNSVKQSNQIKDTINELRDRKKLLNKNKKHI